MAYYIKFIMNWNNSELEFIGPPSAPVYPSGSIRDSRFDYDVCLLGDGIDFDALKMVADDFYLREPREATLTFKLSDWLFNEFSKENDHEIKTVLFLDEDGDSIEYSGSTAPSWEIGEMIGGKTVSEKETMIQQYSKYVIEIWDGNLNKKIFTGLVDKSNTSKSDTEIEINCVDMMDVTFKFAESLIKIYGDIDNEDYYDYIFSKGIVDELSEKVRMLTKLNIEYSNPLSEYIYIDYDPSLESNNYIQIGDQYLSDLSYIPANGLILTEEYQSADVFLDELNKRTVLYKKYLAYIVDEAYEFVSVRLYINYMFIEYDGPLGHDGNGIYSEVRNVRYNLYETEYDSGTQDGIGEQIEAGFSMSEKEAVVKFKRDNNSSTAYLFDKNRYAIIQKQNDYYWIRDYTQDRYSVVFLIYAGQYTYLEIIKTTMFLNLQTMYSDENGIIIVKKKEELENPEESIIDINENAIMLDSFLENGITKDSTELSVLDIIYFDSTNPISKQTFLDLKNQMKLEWSNLFLNKYPKEFSATLFNHTIMPMIEYDELSIARVIRRVKDDSYYVIRSIKPEYGTKFEVEGYKIKGYGS